MKRWIWLSALVAGLVGSMVVRAGTLVQFRTVFGDVEVELYDQEKPITVQNFLRYVNAGAYRDTFFHEQVPNLRIRGGGFTVTNRGESTALVVPMVVFPPITNEFTFGPLLSNVAGTIAMEKTSGNPDSATSQFFFNLADNSKLLDTTNSNGGFTVFGRVVGGTNAFKVFNSFAVYNICVPIGDGRQPWPADKPLTNAVVCISATSFDRLPVTRILDKGKVTPNETVFIDITTLKVSVRKLESGAREISWDAVRTATNVVEYTSVFPAQWQTLETLVKPENPRPAVLDGSGDDLRFYRVRVAF